MTAAEPRPVPPIKTKRVRSKKDIRNVKNKAALSLIHI